MRWLLGLGLTLVLANGAMAQTPPQPDPYLVVLAERVNFSSDGVRVADRVERGESIIVMPVTHRRTGILRNDVRLDGGFANFLNANVPGFYAGEFAVVGPGSIPGSGNVRGALWCFARRADELSAGTRCLVGHDDSWVVAGEPTNMYFPMSAQVGPNASFLNPPVIDEQPVSVNPNLTANYVFRGWGRAHADVQLQLGGRPLLAVGVFKRIQREADGSALLLTPHGVIRLQQDGRSRTAAIVSMLPAQ